VGAIMSGLFERLEIKKHVSVKKYKELEKKLEEAIKLIKLYVINGSAISQVGSQRAREFLSKIKEG
jgi:hypothetical protein